MFTKFRNSLSGLVLSAALITLFALAFAPNRLQVASASVNKPYPYDATGVMLSAIAIRPISERQPFYYDATAAMLDAITVEPTAVTQRFFYDATAAMLKNIVFP